MKKKFSREVRKNGELHEPMQELVDDVARITQRGLSWSENLPGQIYSIRVNSGTEFSLPNLAGFKCRGGALIFVSDNATVTAQSYRQASNNMNMTVTFSDNRAHEIVLFCLYE